MHELLKLKSSLNPEAEAPKAVGELAMRTIDALARRKATEASNVIYGDESVSARTSLDMGTAGHKLTLSNFARVRSILGTWENDDSLFVVISPWQYEDLLTTSGNAIVNRQGYTENGANILYNYEVGKLMGVRLIVSPQAKIAYAAGVANATDINTTIATSTTANRAGDRTIEVASATSIAVGMWLTIGTPQTTTESDSNLTNEIVRVASISSATLTIVGSGVGGGLMYDHAVGEAINNNDSVHLAVFGHGASLGVDFAQYGRYGQMVAPFQDGNAKQWTTYSFKYFGGYGVLDESQLVRVETSSGGL